LLHNPPIPDCAWKETGEVTEILEMTSSATAFRAFTYVIPKTVLYLRWKATECIGIQ